MFDQFILKFIVFIEYQLCPYKAIVEKYLVAHLSVIISGKFYHKKLKIFIFHVKTMTLNFFVYKMKVIYKIKILGNQMS